MKKKLIMKAHEMAKDKMGTFQKEYGKEAGKNIAYATMMKMAKEKKLASGGMVEGNGYESTLEERKAKRPNPYTGNVPSADDIEGASEGNNFADGGEVDKKKGAVMAIVAKLAKKPMGESMESPEHEAGEGEGEEVHQDEIAALQAQKAAAEEVMSAFKSGDTSALLKALKNFHMACDKEYELEESEDEEAGIEE